MARRRPSRTAPTSARTRREVARRRTERLRERLECRAERRRQERAAAERFVFGVDEAFARFRAARVDPTAPLPPVDPKAKDEAVVEAPWLGQAPGGIHDLQERWVQRKRSEALEAEAKAREEALQRRQEAAKARERVEEGLRRGLRVYKRERLRAEEDRLSKEIEREERRKRRALENDPFEAFRRQRGGATSRGISREQAREAERRHREGGGRS